MWNQDDFINRVQELADNHDTTLKQVTREVGISNSSFTDWKKGRGIPSIEKFCKVADFFHVSLDYLAYGIEHMPQTDSSNSLMDKFNSLPPEMQSKVISYMDGMIAALSLQSEIRLSS